MLDALLRCDGRLRNIRAGHTLIDQIDILVRPCRQRLSTLNTVWTAVIPCKGIVPVSKHLIQIFHIVCGGVKGLLRIKWVNAPSRCRLRRKLRDSLRTCFTHGIRIPVGFQLNLRQKEMYGNTVFLCGCRRHSNIFRWACYTAVTAHLHLSREFCIKEILRDSGVFDAKYAKTDHD